MTDTTGSEAMTVEPKACPFCGEEPMRVPRTGTAQTVRYYCAVADCPAAHQPRTLDVWNRRDDKEVEEPKKKSCESCGFPSDESVGEAIRAKDKELASLRGEIEERDRINKQLVEKDHGPCKAMVAEKDAEIEKRGRAAVDLFDEVQRMKASLSRHQESVRGLVELAGLVAEDYPDAADWKDAYHRLRELARSSLHTYNTSPAKESAL